MVSMEEKARKLVEVFPSFHELMNDHAIYRIHKILFKKEIKMYSKKQEWKGVALAADKISSYMNGHVFWTECDFDDNGKGSATVVIDRMKTIEVDFYTFCALIILFYISSINMKISKDQYLAWRDFTDDEEMRKLLE
jgi:hypothetical protein